MLHLVVAGLLAGALPVSDPAWQLTGDATVEVFDGRETLRVDTGAALRRDVSIQDGTIEFDVMVSRRRSFVYVTFRMQDDREFDEMYLRPHKSSLPDAVQYAPVYQGASAWQLNHGPGATAALAFEPGRWTPVRLVLSGRRAALFVGDMTRPALLVPHLPREPRAGYVGLRAFVPTDTPGTDAAARFANVRFTSTPAVDLATLAPPPRVEEPGRVREWLVSDAISWTPGAGLPAPPPAASEKRPVVAEPSGLVELHRYVTLPTGSREMTVAARVRVNAPEPGTRAFDLGFSDRATVFLNGEPVFTGEATYSYAGRREGLIGYEQARLYLPLRKGANELRVVLWDTFGGMGLMGRFTDSSGLSVEAR